jgi:hypothetical protein
VNGSDSAAADAVVENTGPLPYSPYTDSSGAANYIVIVVLVYGLGIIFFIASQVRSTDKQHDEADGLHAEKILRSMETEIFTKEILGSRFNIYVKAVKL